MEPSDFITGGWPAADPEACRVPVAEASLGNSDSDAATTGTSSRLPRPSVGINVTTLDGGGDRGTAQSKSARASLRRGSGLLVGYGWEKEGRRRSLELVDGRVQDLGDMLLAVYRCARMRGPGVERSLLWGRSDRGT